VATSFLVYALAEGMDVRYVGYSARPERRRKAHAQRRPGWQWLVLGAYGSVREALERERWWIKRLHDAGHPLTNISDGGTPGYFLGVHSSLTRERFSKAHRGHAIPTQQRAKISASMKGKRNALGYRHAPEVYAARAVAQKGHRGYMLGRRHTADTKAKMSAAHKGNHYRGTGFHHSVETRAKMSAAHKGLKYQPRRKAEA
jgi:hypothetical protein